MAPPRPLVRLAERQLGVFARWQLHRDLADSAVDELIRGGWCERLERGVHRIVGGARLPEQVAVAATLRCGPGATLTGPAALRLFGIDGVRRDAPFVVLVPPGRRVTNVAFPVRRDADPERAVARWGEVRVAGPVDALIDSAPLVAAIGTRTLSLVHAVLRWRDLIAPGQLTVRVRELGRTVPDGPGLRELLELDGTAATGDGERELGRLLGLFDPPPEPQVWVTPTRRVDWYFRSVRYGYEYQGSVDHGTIAGRIRDDERDDELRREGVRLGYVTGGDLAHERTLLATVAGTLASRAHELGVTPPTLQPR